MMDHEDLVQPANGPEEPGRLEIHGVRVASDEMLGEDHDEPLEDDEEEILLVRLGRLQAFLHFLHLQTEIEYKRLKRSKKRLKINNRSSKFLFKIHASKIGLQEILANMSSKVS